MAPGKLSSWGDLGRAKTQGRPSGETLFSLVRGLLELDEDVAKSIAQNARILAVGLGQSGKFYDRDF